MTIRNLYPVSRPVAIYNVISGRPELPSFSSFSRAVEGTYIDSAGVLKTAAIDEPRIEYDPYTGELIGLMLEDSAINGCINTDRAGINSIPSGTASNGYNFTLEATGGPDGGEYIRCEKVAEPTSSPWVVSIDYRGLNVSQNTPCIMSLWARSPNTALARFSNPDTDAVVVDLTPEWRRIYVGFRYAAQGPTLTSMRWDRPGDYPIGTILEFCKTQSEVLPTGSDWTNVKPSDATSYYANTSTTTGSSSTRQPDVLSFNSIDNFDNGFSLMLDSLSDRIEDKVIYKIKKDDDVISELQVNKGTLEWDIGGISAQEDNQFPQLGYVPGRLKTVSAFGAADGAEQQNYLYTTGVSFPFRSAVPAGANSLELGAGQYIKALYLWDVELTPVNAVSFIKGQYNIIRPEPIVDQSFSFAYNTDTENIGNQTVSFPDIVPEESMTIDWGDGNRNNYERGVDPTHTYPYPGVYRIQVIPNNESLLEGFSISDIDDSVRIVEQWAPQYRVGASGDGFTGNDLASLLDSQSTCTSIPPFKYTDITSLASTFKNCSSLEVNNWEWVPTECQSVTTMKSAFRDCNVNAENFPQLQTSSALTNLDSCFFLGPKSFVDPNGQPTLFPWTDTSQVTTFVGVFANVGITAIGQLDTGNATTIQQMFQNCTQLTSLPTFDLSKVTNFASAFSGANKITSLPPFDYQSATTLKSLVSGCTALTTVPSINSSNCTVFQSMFQNCSSLVSAPIIDMSKGSSCLYMFSGCTLLENVPPYTLANETAAPNGINAQSMFDGCDSLSTLNIDFSNVNYARYMFRGCAFTTAPPIDSAKNTDLYAAYRGNPITALPAMDVSSVENFSQCFQYCLSLTDVTELANWDVTSARTFANMFNLCPIGGDGLEFPAGVFDSLPNPDFSLTGFQDMFNNCALNPQSIENILVSLVASGLQNNTTNLSNGNGGTNAAKSQWTAAANTAFDTLVNDRGWDITYEP